MLHNSPFSLEMIVLLDKVDTGKNSDAQNAKWTIANGSIGSSRQSTAYMAKHRSVRFRPYGLQHLTSPYWENYDIPIGGKHAMLH